METAKVNEYNNRRTNHVVTTKAWTQPAKKSKKSKDKATRSKKDEEPDEQTNEFSVLSRPKKDKIKATVNDKTLVQATNINGDLIS